uniref:Uncharacterized protein n=1 Tax=Lactuca sativa TaxID=4236 RepID=A0A9R1WIC8_LACSA|nr:hypothetical protein LSAT_V11C100028080 [Lactuca sativa]
MLRESAWLDTLRQLQLNNTHYWKHLQTCLVKTDDCSNLSKRFKTLKQYELAKLIPIEVGCCRPPSVCGYPVVNASYYDLTFHPISSNKDCLLYKIRKPIRCYNCDSCKVFFHVLGFGALSGALTEAKDKL